MRPGDALLAHLPQADGRSKDRPVLCSCSVPPFHDFLVCGITTQLTNRVAYLDEVIAENDEDFPKAGLKAASLIRTACLALLPKSRFQGRSGFVSQERHRLLLNALATFLQEAA